MESTLAIRQLLECHVCMTLMYPPIHQCCNGHTICFKCKARVNNSCPTCRQELGNIRSIALEKLLELLDIPCNFNESGCQYISSYHDRLEHEKVCSFRPYNCPYDAYKCSFSGDSKSLVEHLKEIHSVKVFDECNFRRTCLLSNDEIRSSKWVFPQISSHSGNLFMVHFETFNLRKGLVFMGYVRIVGEESDANNFRYSLEVGGKERKIVWEGIPRSIRDSDKTVRDSLDGLIIEKKNIPLFSSGDADGSSLSLNSIVRIWRKENS